jgi:hypothetical protein
VKHGENPFSEDRKPEKSGTRTYVTRRALPDGRELYAQYCDVNGRGPNNPERNASLELILKPKAEKEYGYETLEWGLTGIVALYREYYGPNNSSTYVGVRKADMPLHREYAAFQNRRYQELLKEVLGYLQGK